VETAGQETGPTGGIYLGKKYLQVNPKNTAGDEASGLVVGHAITSERPSWLGGLVGSVFVDDLALALASKRKHPC
jgi:hypothetical protein